VLARPVTDIPAAQGGALVEEMRIVAAGTGGGTAVDLAQLGVPVTAEGLVRSGIAQTSATVLPIRPNGERPAPHCSGAYPALQLHDRQRQIIENAGHLHIGGPERFQDHHVITEAATLARRVGAGVSVDLLAGNPLEWAPQIQALLPFVDVFCPNDDQICLLYGVDDAAAAAQSSHQDGAGVDVASAGPEGAIVVDDRGTRSTI
jgi:sugar/nucleoside kinase (ribokinase family)